MTYEELVTGEDVADAYQFGWSHAEMAIGPMMFEYRIREWDTDLRVIALGGYIDYHRAHNV